MTYQLGCMPELPDHRDWVLDERPETARLFIPPPVMGSYAAPAAASPASIDLSAHCSPIESQGALGSCTAHAVVGVLEYLERRARGRHVDASRLFVYKVGRNLHGWVGDTGLYVRSGMKALHVFGACPEHYWPYDVDEFDVEPGAFEYGYAQGYRATSYYRLDRTGRSKPQLVDLLKRAMVYGLPVAFGFVVYSWGDEDGAFPMPDEGQRHYGGHAVVAVGYDDNLRIGDSTGALKIRNSWGTRWGQAGYGWLPYDYVLSGLAWDFWTIFSQQYVR